MSGFAEVEEILENMGMSTWSVGTTGLQGVHPAMRSLPMGEERPLIRQQDPLSRVRSITSNLFVASCFAVFLYASGKFWLNTGSFVGAGLVVFNTSVVLFSLTRRRPAIVTTSIWNRVFAPAATVLPLLLRPVDSAGAVAIVLTSVGQVLGLTITVASLLVLNRSFGIVAANRGITTRGLYALVRHPLYTGEMVFFISFLTANWSFQNAYLVGALILVQVVRSAQEEALLLRDQHYAKYRAAVAYRFIPRII